MAQSFLTPIDLLKNELQNARVQNLASAPSSPAEGQIYHNTTSHAFFEFDGTIWQELNATFLLARANHTGTQTASTISDLAAVVQAYRLDQFAAPNTDVSLASHKLTNVTTPSASTDAANKAYVDAAINGLDWKASARLKTTANHGLTGLAAIDGVTPVGGDRILVASQSTGSQNGIYVAASGAWTRATDADQDAEVTAGLAISVTEGTLGDNTQWVLTTDDPIVVGTTALTFAQIGSGTSYTGGTGITVSGTTISRDATYVDTVAQGGTNATTAAGARASLGAATVFAASVGDGAATSYNVDHNFGTRDVQVQVFQAATPWAQVFADVTLPSTNRVTVAFATAPTTNQYRVVVIGLG